MQKLKILATLFFAYLSCLVSGGAFLIAGVFAGPQYMIYIAVFTLLLGHYFFELNRSKEVVKKDLSKDGGPHDVESMRWTFSIVFLLLCLLYLNLSLNEYKSFLSFYDEAPRPKEVKITELVLAETEGLSDAKKWWTIKDGFVRHDLKSTSGTLWKTTNGSIVLLPEYYYIPVARSETEKPEDTKLFLAIDIEQYNRYETPEDYERLDNPAGIVEKSFFRNQITPARPPFFILFYGVSPYSSEQFVWYAIFGLMLLGAGVWCFPMKQLVNRNRIVLLKMFYRLSISLR